MPNPTGDGERDPFLLPIRPKSPDTSPLMLEDTVGSTAPHSSIGGNGTDREDSECQDEVGNQEHGQSLQQPSMAHHKPWNRNGKAGQWVTHTPHTAHLYTPPHWSLVTSRPKLNTGHRKAPPQALHPPTFPWALPQPHLSTPLPWSWTLRRKEEGSRLPRFPQATK